MDLRMTLTDGRRVQHLALSAPAGLRWHSITDRLPPGWPADPEAYAVLAPRGPIPLSSASTLGEPPLLHGAGLITASPTAPQPDRGDVSAAAPAWMVVVEGPDCGRSWALPAGARVSVGRDPSCRASIQDPALSRRHCTVTATRQGVLVTDLGSTNGARLEGQSIRDQARWTPGRRLLLGSSVLELDVGGPLPLRTEADGIGYLVVTPTAARLPVPPVVQLRTPVAPEKIRPTAPPVLAWALPLLISVGLAMVLRMPMLLLFGLMAPAMMLGSHLGERRQRRIEHHRASTRHTEQLALLDEHVQRAVDHELRMLRTHHLDIARWCAVVRERPGEPLWSRAADPTGMVLRLGRARLPTSVQLDEHPVPAEEAPLLHRWTGTLGIIGPPRLVRALARTLVCQTVLAHDPQTLAVGSAHPDPEWDWLTWALRPSAAGSVRVTLDDRLGRPADRCSTTGVAVLRLARSREELGAVDDLVEILDATSARWHSADAAQPVRFGPDLTSRDLGRWLLRQVAGWRTPEQVGDAGRGLLPRSVPLAAVEPAADDPAMLRRRWEHRPRSTRCLLGLGASGPVVVDLGVDGPHALVAGTTGSGKSELLRTMVTALALVNRPDELVFVLVDYKGGSAFADCAQLPHCVGMVTDLDSHLADRALTSLGAELKRRERLLAAVGARDLTSYQARPGMPTLPRLVLVIDEYRALAEELPSFVDGLVRIAALGRSLGLHLVLATQRPTGIVSADVRANMNLRIALRLRDAADSYDVLESADAAALPEGVPGRALLRTGAEAARAVQVARVVDPLVDAGSSVCVRVLPSLWAAQDTTGAAQEVPAEGEDALPSRIAVAAAQAADVLGATVPASPWLAPLPPVLTMASLAEDATAAAVPWGLLDRPHEQRQEPAWWDPVGEGHMAVMGAPRAGRSTMLRTLCAQLVHARDAGQVHLYLFDSGGGLQVLGEAPHTGALVTAEDPGRAARVLQRLVDTLVHRQRALASRGLTSFAEQQEGGDPWPLVVWVVDGWGRLAQVQSEHARGTGLQDAHRLLAQGPGVGIIAVLAGDRSLLSGQVGPMLPVVWSLRLTDPTDLLMAGLRREQIPVGMPPGRVVRLRDALVGQVGVLGADPAGSAQVAKIAQLLQRHRVRDAAVPAHRRPWRVVELPTTCELADLREPATAPTELRTQTGGEGLQPCPDDIGLLIGVGGDDGSPRGLPLDPGGCAIVVGGAGSGRSSTLRTIAEAARRAGRGVVELDGYAVRLDPAELRGQLTAQPRPVVTVDDTERLADSAVEDVLLTWAASLGTSGGALVVAADSERAGSAYRGLVPLAARDRTGILLCPTAAADGAVLGLHAPTGGSRVPGRGVLVHRGATTLIQVARVQTAQSS